MKLKVSLNSRAMPSVYLPELATVVNNKVVQIVYVVRDDEIKYHEARRMIWGYI